MKISYYIELIRVFKNFKKERREKTQGLNI
jgi:hypothetical protein